MPATQQVIVTTSGAELRLFDAPYAASIVDAQTLREAGPMITLGEALQRVPGLVANHRHNHAQDLQLQSRGFGARASFGVRGLRLVADGVPASGPDGQGQVSHFDLAGAQRIEVLRGPFSALYGASSGGVISLISAAPTQREATLHVDAGQFGLRQQRLSLAAPLGQGFSLRTSVSGMEAPGFRPQSAAQRLLANLRLGYESDSDRVVLVLNHLDQPAQDPLGLTREQFEADTRQTNALALPQDTPGQANRFNTRKDTRQSQAGLQWRHRFADAGALREALVVVYGGQRAVTQWLSIPVAVQANASNPALTERQGGGVIDFERDYGGVDGRMVWRWPLADQRALQVVAGLSHDRSVEQRFGFENFSGVPARRLLGVTGALRRDERNTLASSQLFVQSDAELSEAWWVSAGLRSGTIRFASQDRYIVGGNGDDSGQREDRFTSPVLALRWRLDPQLNLHASVGRGFESPTFGELAYRADGGPGFNTELRAQSSRQVEIGAKWRSAGAAPAADGVPDRALDTVRNLPPDMALDMALDAALFEARTQNEIAVATNRGGRATFSNVGRTLRRGLELQAQARVARDWHASAALTWLDARYSDGFLICGAPPCSTPTVPVPAGNRIAGTVSRSAYVELAWRPQPGYALAVEGRAQGRQAVNDLNSDFADAYQTLALRAQAEWALGPAGSPVGKLQLLLRLDNATDIQASGSVIVNEGNGRYFEPLAPRAWLVSLGWTMPF